MEKNTSFAHGVLRFCVRLAVALLPVSVPLWAEARQAVVLETTEGNITIELYDETPLHRDNFLRLVGEGFYDSLLFHRVAAYFVVQAGDPASRHAQPGHYIESAPSGEGVPAEIRLPQLFHKRGAVGMARRSDGRPESDATQFYIVWGKRHASAVLDDQQERLDTLDGSPQMSAEMWTTYRKVGGLPHLDGEYTVFGEVIDGLDVVERMSRADTDDYDRPIADLRILRAVVVERED